MARIEISQLGKSYGHVPIVHDISLSISDGEFVVLVGPSGCGKSTLLRTIAGLETITSGTISFNGKPVNRLPPQERNIAMVFQNYALYPHLTVYDNLAFGLKLKKLPKAEIATRIQEAARMLSLEPYLSRRPRELSGGQRQRVAMGRAMVRKANAFLFDEPLSNLDAQLRVQMRVEIRRLQQALAATAIYVTHDQIEAMTMGDRIVVMNKGRIEQVGTPAELYERPANRFVASFIGSPSMNFLNADARGSKARLADGTVVTLPTPVEGPVTLGIRPEHLQTIEEAGEGAAVFEVPIIRRFELGAQTEIFSELAGTPIQVLRNGNYGRGESRMPVALSHQHLHVFDREGCRVGR
ncbi:ABC transporter ATP-binding protein [Microvirga sp. GCM10011540]|uniref:ABC transporter ATP-binding protein n=1 Tax=Microvirga sp. GCM10011540 TaxID=3317338 RepID=UPI00361752B9